MIQGQNQDIKTNEFLSKMKRFCCTAGLQNPAERGG